MHKRIWNWLKTDYNFILAVVFLCGILVRTVCLTAFPQGVNQDEAYAGYEGYALLKQGVDSHGYHNPVYFVSWGTGMNVLYSYLCMLPIKLGGLSILMVRLPQAALGCVSLFVFYLLLKEAAGRKAAVAGSFLLAVNPWHIMMSRWGLESNLAPFFLLCGMYFMIRAFNGKVRYYIAAFAAFGLSLYCYAIMWLFVPLLLFLMLLYGLWTGKVRWSRYLGVGIGLIAVLSVPLVLFLLVNNGIIGEIRTPLLSIPRMEGIRSGEFSFTGIKSKIKALALLLLWQKDGLAYNSPQVGIYYLFSMPFIAYGAGLAAVRFVKNLSKRMFEAADFLFLWGVAAGFVGCLIQSVNVNKVNCIHVPVICFGLFGLLDLVKRVRWLKYPAAAAYIGAFAVFCSSYFLKAPVSFYDGYEDALDYAVENTNEVIGVAGVRYSNLLLYSGMLPEDFMASAVYEGTYAEVKRMGRYIVNVSPAEAETLGENTLSVVPKDLEADYTSGALETVYDNGKFIVVSNR